eukprot:2875566-Pleurochrysis_carterae.AAC.5
MHRCGDQRRKASNGAKLRRGPRDERASQRIAALKHRARRFARELELHRHAAPLAGRRLIVRLAGPSLCATMRLVRVALTGGRYQ